jgi:hypothetical protein
MYCNNVKFIIPILGYELENSDKNASRKSDIFFQEKIKRIML